MEWNHKVGPDLSKIIKTVSCGTEIQTQVFLPKLSDSIVSYDF